MERKKVMEEERRRQVTAREQKELEEARQIQEAHRITREEEQERRNKHCKILVSCSDKERNCMQANVTAFKLL